jgi:hypothetical protein
MTSHLYLGGRLNKQIAFDLGISEITEKLREEVAARAPFHERFAHDDLVAPRCRHLALYRHAPFRLCLRTPRQTAASGPSR